MNDDYELSPLQSLAQSFVEGGIWMYPIAALACLLPLLAMVFLVMGATATTNRALPLSVALLVLSVLPPSLGTLGARFARAEVEQILNSVDPADRATIQAGAESELMNLTLWGFGAALIPGLLGCILLGIGLSRLKRFRARPA